MSAPFFRKSRPIGPVLSRQESARQGAAVKSAADAFGDHDAVRAFLNTHHDGLGGRPLDLAVASEAGLAAVEAELGLAAGRPAAAGAGA